MSKTSKHSNIVMPTVEEDEKITSAAESDPDALPLSSNQLEKMVPFRSLRGRPKSENKKLLVSIRYSAEVIEYFKASGSGWQSRMNAVLSEYVQRNSEKSESNH